jgi:hypothetical protein
MKKLSSVTISGGLTVDQATTLSGVVSVGGIGTGAYTSVLVRNSSNQMLYRNYSDFLNDISGSLNLSGYVPTSRTLTINGTTYDLSANRTWTITTPFVSKLQHQVKAGVAINKGQAVYVTSADGTNMIVGLASNASEATSSKTMGLLDATVSTNGFANVVTEGLLAGLDTSTAGTEGDPVWLGTGGNLIYGLANKPYAPAHLVFIGIVTRKNANNGEIFVKVQNGFELKEIHDVDLITSAPTAGQLLRYNSDGLWKNWSPNYLTAETDTLATVTNRGNSTTGEITVNGTTTIQNGGYLKFIAGSVGTTGFTVFNAAQNGYLSNRITTSDHARGWGWELTDALATTASPGVFFRIGYNGTASYLTSGNFGIGTTTPNQRLSVEGGSIQLNANNVAANYYLNLNKKSGQDGGIVFTRDNAADWQLTNGAGNGDLIFYSYGTSTEAITFKRGTGDVGIGNTAPGYKLDVNGTFGVSGNATFNGSNVYINSDNSYIGNNTTDLVSLSGSTMYFPGNGRVGINTTTPTAPLEIINTGSAGGGLTMFGSAYYGGLKYWGMRIYGIDNGQGIHYSTDVQVGATWYSATKVGHGQNATNPSFQSYYATYLATDGGNVGIGTTSPGWKLHVAGESYTSGVVRIGGTNPFYFEDYGGGWFMSDSTWVRTSNSKSVWVGGGLLGGDGGLTIGYGGTGSPSGGAIIAGNVGIGTASPGSKLSVFGNNDVFSVISQTGDTSFATRLLAQYVGLFNNGANGHHLYVSSTQELGPAEFNLTKTWGGFLTFGVSGDGTARTRALYVNSNGYVGVNVNPISGDRFEVAGSVRIHTGNNWDAIQIYSDGANGYIQGLGDETGLRIRSEYGNILLADNRGNVGIGTTTPQKKLDVNGTGIVASFGGTFSPGAFAGLHFGYSESASNNDSYKKSALVFERTDNHGQGGNASGKIHFLLNNIASASATSLSHSVMVIDTDSAATQGSARVGIGTTSPSTALTVNGVITATGGNSTNWNTAYGWGNHASAGYLTSVSDIWVNTTGDTMSGTLSFQQPVGLSFANGQYIKDNNTGGLIIYSGAAVNINGTSVTINGNTAWHSGNDGSGSGLDADTVDGVQASSLLRSDIYNSNYGGLQVFRNIGTIDGSWEDSNHTFSLENGDAGNIVLNFHRAGYTSNNLWYNGSKFRFDAALESTGVITATGGNSTNWNTAYGWGNHASAGYLTSYSETDTLNSVTGRGASTSNAITVGATTINGVWQTNISTSGGWSKLSFTASNAWGDGNTYGTLGASGGNEPGVMVYNMHATWAGSGQGAGIRMGRSGGVIGGDWYQVATMDANEFMIAKNGQWSNGGIKITSGGELQHGNSGNKYWHAGNDGSGSGLDADLLDGQNSTEFLRLLSGGAEASLDSYTDNGIRSVSFTGHSQHLLSWNAGGSTGTVQQLFHYGTPNNGWRIRNKTDNSSWSDWGYVVMASSNQGLISGTIATQSWVGSQSYATTSYVTTQINNLINGAPGALDTLDELAAALGDDSNFATTVTNSIAGKVSKAGDTITTANQYGLVINHTPVLGDFVDALLVRSSTSGQRAQIGFATVDADGDHHRASIRAYKGPGTLEGAFGIALRQAGSGAHIQRFTLDYLGNVTIGGFLTESSSIKLKENVETSEGNLEKVVNLRPVTYNKIGSQTTELGLIAEEVAEVYPEFVQYDENGEPIGVNYSRLTAALIGAVKELTNQVQELNKKING